MRATLVVSLHDVAPASSEATSRFLDELHRWSIPLSLLVIPGLWRGRRLIDDAAFVRLLADRAAAGDEVVQHGWRHCVGADSGGWRSVTERALARGAGEFAAVSEPAALLRLRAGRNTLQAVGLPATGFTAPGWLHSPGTIRALRTLGFSYTTTHRGVHELATDRRVAGPAFSHRSGGAGQYVARTLYSMGPSVIAARGGLVRLALHPDDLDEPELLRCSLRTIKNCLNAGAQPTTYAGVLRDTVTAVSG